MDKKVVKLLVTVLMILLVFPATGIPSLPLPFDVLLNPPSGPPVWNNTDPQPGPDPTPIPDPTPVPVPTPAPASLQEFLSAFMIVYVGEWVYVENSADMNAVVVVSSDSTTCSNDECCGTWKAYEVGGTETVAEGLFCLKSTWEVIVRDHARTWKVCGVGERGHLCSVHHLLEGGCKPSGNIVPFGYSVGEPTTIDFGDFRLIRPE